MAGSTVIIEVHGWRGFHIVGGPFGRVLVFGFISASYMPFLLSERLKQMIGKLKNVAGDSRGFVEMACVGEEPFKRINGGKPLHVPQERE